MQAGGTTERGPRLREATGVAVLWFCATVAWSSFLGLVTQATSERASLRDPLFFGIAIFAGANAIRSSGLLALANHDRDPHPTRARAWWSWFKHFKLSVATLALSGVAVWLASSWFLGWLVQPFARPWGITSPAQHLVFANAHDVWTTKLSLVVGLATVPAVPVFASDLWRLLTPLMSARAARLRLPFAIATALVALLALLLCRESALGLVAMMLPTSNEL